MTKINEPQLTHFEERLLAELREVVAGQPGAQPAKAPRPRRLVIAAAIGVSAAVAAGLMVATAARPSGKPTVRYSLAADFLNRAATAARAQNTPLPKPDQAEYIEQLVVAPGPQGGIRECIVTWSPWPLTGLAGDVGDGKCGPGVPAVPSVLKDLSPSPGDTHLYPALNTLPTNPAALRAALYAAAARGGAAWGRPTYSTDQIVYSMISNLLVVPLSGSLRAALYEMIAQIPGVTLVRNAVDAAGRHGTGITMPVEYPGYGRGTVEIILAPRTFTVLGAENNMPGQRVHFAILGSGLVTVRGT